MATAVTAMQLSKVTAMDNVVSAATNSPGTMPTRTAAMQEIDEIQYF